MTPEEITFANILSNPLYKDRDVIFALLPPEGLVHRTEQKNELIMELAPILMNSTVSGIFVYGNPGTGKTALITELADKLEHEAKKKDIELKRIYVNCSENRTETTIIIDLLSQLNPDKEYPRLGWTRAKAVSELYKSLNDKTINVLVVLDEIDYALREAGDDILYRLSRINNEVKSKVNTIIISNDVRVSDYIKPRTQSAFGRVKIVFSPYNAEELEDILKTRIKYAFKVGVVGEPILKKICELEAQHGGDARKALELLDSCAKSALSKGRDKLTLDLVDEAYEYLERNSVVNSIAALTKHQKILFLTMLKNEKKVMIGGDVYKEYMQMCENYNVKPLTERSVRSMLVNFTELGLIQSEIGWLSNLNKKIRKITFNLDKGLKKKVEKLLRDTI